MEKWVIAGESGRGAVHASTCPMMAAYGRSMRAGAARIADSGMHDDGGVRPKHALRACFGRAWGRDAIPSGIAAPVKR